MTPEPNFGLFDFQSNSLDFLNTLYYLEMGWRNWLYGEEQKKVWHWNEIKKWCDKRDKIILWMMLETNEMLFFAFSYVVFYSILGVIFGCFWLYIFFN
jgi:preprotein translocase subunit SecY